MPLDAPIDGSWPGLPDGRAMALRALAAGLRPPPELRLSAWAAEKRVVAAESGSPHAGPWSNDLAPYLVEIMDCLGSDDPCRSVVLKKSHQVGGSECGVNFIGYLIDHDPSPVLLVLPSLDEMLKFVRLKLQPAIDATPCVAAKVLEQKSRDEKGSTTTLKRYPGGSLVCTGANSSKGLQMISVRAVILDEVAEYPHDVDGRGDPVAMAEKRTTAWSTSRKIFYLSTPGIKGACRITIKFEASDQRRYYVPCPQCGAHQVLKWANLEWDSDTPPHGAYFVCQANGCTIEHYAKREMVAGGVWIKCYGEDGERPPDVIEPDDLQRWRERPSGGREPGFHIWQAYSPFISWDDTVADWLEADGDPQKETVFTQQDLGEAYEATGNAPDHELLLQRRERYEFGRIPAGALFLTAGVDVQGNRLEWAVWGWGIGKSSWLVDKGIIEGDTADDLTWRGLDPVRDRHYEDWQGNLWPIEAMAVDSGFNTQTVYRWVRRRRMHGDQRVMAVKGMPGHLAPALGTPTPQDVSARGKKLRGGVMLWPVGQFTLKSEFYANLKKTVEGPDDETGLFKPGYVHLPLEADEGYLQQMTAEFLKGVERPDGTTNYIWVKLSNQPNEALDIRVYAAAAAVHMKIDRMTADDWARLARDRGAPPEDAQRDLAALWAPPLVPEGAPPRAPEPATESTSEPAAVPVPATEPAAGPEATPGAAPVRPAAATRPHRQTAQVTRVKLPRHTIRRP